MIASTGSWRSIARHGKFVSCLAELPTDSVARRGVLDQIINALSLPDALILDPRDVPAGALETVYARTAQLLGKTLTVEQTDETILHPFFRVPGQVVRVNGQDLHVFVYPDETSRKSDSARISADGRLIAGEVVNWPVTPRFVSSGNVLTVLLSSDSRLAGRVERAIGTLGDQSTMDSVVKALGEDALRAWTDYIESEMAQNFLVRLEDDLTTDQAALCRAHLNEVPGVKVMNQLDYLVENGRYLERIVIKTGVPRETALKLEANKLYLPGVELEDGVLIRRYPGGEAMSHILGYVSQISQRDLDDPRNQDELGYAVYDPTDSIGKDGLELDLESTLRGERGRRIIEMDASGSSWRVVPDSTIDPAPGKNVALTIDLELQRAASEILRAGIAYSNADRHAIERADPTRPSEEGVGRRRDCRARPANRRSAGHGQLPALRQPALRRRHLPEEVPGVCQRGSEQAARGPRAARRIPGGFDDQAIPGGRRASGRKAHSRQNLHLYRRHSGAICLG